MSKRGKHYNQATEMVKEQLYELAPALELLREFPKRAFTESVELHFKLNVDTQKQDQQIRESVSLPNGIGKVVRVLVFAKGEDAEAAKDAGADFIGEDDLIKKVESGWLDFDVVVASQEMMPKIGKLGRILGGKGLMPSPKAGTVVKDGGMKKIVQDIRKGRVEMRTDKTGCIHARVGTVEFSNEQLLENIKVLYDSLIQATPDGIKGALVKSANLCATMSPAIGINIADLDAHISRN